MNISYQWLKDLVDLDLTPEQTAEKLTSLGLAVEGIHAHGDDSVFDIDLTSNRPDCLSHLGVARELSANLGLPLKVSSVTAAGESGDRVEVRDSELCPRFTARVITDVTVGPSPQWLINRLEAIGERSINNVADITNYVMHELGQPMHSFDLDKLSGRRLVVRRAAADEKITTLDEVERVLDSSMLAICDAERPVAVAGIMGGLESSITESTTNVLLEVAYFSRPSIRATSRQLGLATEASYRFERGIDIENLVQASERAAQFITGLAGGAVESFVDIYPRPFEAGTIDAPDITASVLRLTGLSVEENEAVRILNGLGITRVGNDTYSSPSWRHDLTIEEDLVEEVARHTGLANIVSALPPAFGAGEYQESEGRKKQLRQTLVDLGLHEAITYSFIDTRSDDVFEIVPGVEDSNASEKHVTLQDSVIEGAVRMRPSVLPGLLDAVRLNLNHNRRDVSLFEIGKVFAGKLTEDRLPNEQELLGIVMTGSEVLENRALASRALDFYDAKGAVEAALEAVGATAVTFAPADIKHLQPGQSASISFEGQAIGSVGRLRDVIAQGYKFKQNVYVGEINLDPILGAPMAGVVYKPLTKFPGMVRDVSFTVGRSLAFEEIRAAITEQGFELCRSVVFADIYEGKGLEEGQRSLTVRLEYRSDDRTLLESEVEDIHQRIIEQTTSKLGISVRA